MVPLTRDARRVRFMAKAELWRYPPVRWAMEAYGTFPVERGSGDTGAMTRAGELLAEGTVLGMFPRGTSNPAGNRTWHRGAARLASKHRSDLRRHWSTCYSGTQALWERLYRETAHTFQGREAPVVIFDFVLDEPHRQAGLFDPSLNESNLRLLNVALTAHAGARS